MNQAGDKAPAIRDFVYRCSYENQAIVFNF